MSGVVMCSISGINRCVGFVCSAFGSAWFGIIMSGYTSALQITDVFGCLVTRLLYRLQMCLVAWLHVCFTDCRCVWLFGYMSALQIADVFGFAWFCMILHGTCLLYRLQMCLVVGLHTFALQIADVFGSSFALVWMHLFGLPRIETLSSTESAL
ncbi:hypothetical protein Tco_1039010 [Tanacetum coccineum]